MISESKISYDKREEWNRLVYLLTIRRFFGFSKKFNQKTEYNKILFDKDRIHKLLEETKKRMNLTAGDRLIRSACICGNISYLTWLLKYGNGNPAKSDMGLWTPLILASRYGFLNIIQILLDYGVPINNITTQGWSALIYSVYNKNYEIVSLLLKHGADIHQTTVTNNGWNALIYAIYNKDSQMVKLLLDADITPNVVYVTEDGYSAISILRIFSSEMDEILKCLIDLYKRQERKGIKRVIQKAASGLNVISCDDTEHVITLFSGAF